MHVGHTGRTTLVIVATATGTSVQASFCARANTDFGKPDVLTFNLSTHPSKLIVLKALLKALHTQFLGKPEGLHLDSPKLTQ
jgi:hypothetical protein